MARKKSVLARIFIANMISLVLYSVFYFINFLIYMILYGFDGAKVSIQAIGVFASSEYLFSVGEMAIIMFVEGVLATCAISMIVCMCSCYRKSTFSVLSNSLIIIIAPIFFDFTDIMPYFQRILELFPIYSLNIISQYKSIELYHNSILLPILSGVVSIVIILFNFLCIKQYFRYYSLKKHYS